jgi:O-antigen biosynthesis protein
MTAPSIPFDRAHAPADHAVVIGGMHRSGTSLLASLFEGAGVSVGERLMGSGPGNEAGHFEDLDFYDFHQRALAGNGLSAEGFTADALPLVPDILHAEAAALVSRRRDRGGIWGWKDPRTVLFLDFWAELLPDARYVFVFRRPGEVVDSFFRRGDPTFVFHPLLAAQVWLHYNRLILDFVARHPERCLVREATQIAADPGELFAAIRDRLGVPVGEPPARFRPDLLGHDADGRRTRLVAEACPGAMDVYLELRARAGSTEPLPDATGPTAAETAIVEWARAARFERENAEVRRDWLALRDRADAEAAALRARLASWEAVAAEIQTSLAAIEGVDTSCSARLVALCEAAPPQPRAEAA